MFDKLLSFHKRHRWLSHIAYWLIVLLVDVSSSKYHDGETHSYGFEFLTDFLYEITYIMVAYGLAYWIIPRVIYRRQYILPAIAFIFLSYAASALGRIIIVKICEPLAGVKPKPFETYTKILTDIPKLLYVYFFQVMAAAFTFVFFKICKDQLEIQKRALMLEKEKTETELKLLKAQLNPHFLFNTLNNIYSLSFISQPATSQSIARLADMLDHILYRCNGQYVALQAEIELINNYIELEKLRYDERLTINFSTEIEYSVQIAPLVLLSLVENAFKHGASGDAGMPEIDISLHADKENIFFAISNTTVAHNDAQQTGATERIGLNNLRRQLGLVYGGDYQLDVVRNGKRFTVRLSINLKKRAANYEKNAVLIGG